MRIIDIDPVPVAEIAYARASRAGCAEHVLLDFLAVRVDRLPDGLDAIIVTADLQGYGTDSRSHSRLLGEAVAGKAAELAADGRIGPSENVGVLLAGDYWADPDLTSRGGVGDVREVWSAFGGRFRWVCGVAGNHDQFTAAPGNAPFALAAKRQFAQETGFHALDDDFIQLGALRIAGVGGVIGNPAKPFRRSRERFAEALTRLIRLQPDLLVCHEGFNSHGLDEDPEVEASLMGAKDLVVVHGHRHGEPGGTLRTGQQVLNCCERVLVLRAGGAPLAAGVLPGEG